jgi:hypothetical protein
MPHFGVSILAQPPPEVLPLRRAARGVARTRWRLFRGSRTPRPPRRQGRGAARGAASARPTSPPSAAAATPRSHRSYTASAAACSSANSACAALAAAGPRRATSRARWRSASSPILPTKAAPPPPNDHCPIAQRARRYRRSNKRCLGNLPPIASRTSSSVLPASPFAAAKPWRSGTVSRSQTMTLPFMGAECCTMDWASRRLRLSSQGRSSRRQTSRRNNPTSGGHSMVPFRE